MFFVGFHPLFDVFNFLLGESWDLCSRGSEGDDGDLRNLWVKVRCVRGRSDPRSRGLVSGREERGYG